MRGTGMRMRVLALGWLMSLPAGGLGASLAREKIAEPDTLAVPLRGLARAIAEIDRTSG